MREGAETNDSQTKRLQVVERQIERGFTKHPYLMGKKTVYGVMPDWNPAEIVGIRPKPCFVFVQGNGYRFYMGISKA